ncbi:MAG: hypothetical protein HY927_01345 [Elusimicrobia bacterium]|nr:hypothetical protein [Elusimicrobiota bacterium]
MPARKSPPATQADLAGASTALKTDIQNVRTELKADIRNLDHKIDCVAMGVVKTNERLEGVEDRLKAEMRQLNSQVLTALDTSVARMETLWRESAILPAVVDEHGQKLRDHEGRLVRLESSRP